MATPRQGTSPIGKAADDRYRVKALTRSARSDSARQIRGIGDRFVVGAENAGECFVTGSRTTPSPAHERFAAKEIAGARHIGRSDLLANA